MSMDSIREILGRLDGHDRSRLILIIIAFVVFFGLIAHIADGTDKTEALEKRIEALEKERSQPK
jgi:hypothetical protein